MINTEKFNISELVDDVTTELMRQNKEAKIKMHAAWDEKIRSPLENTKSFSISEEILVELLATSVEGIPPSARIMSVIYDNATATINVSLFHPHFQKDK